MLGTNMAIDSHKLLTGIKDVWNVVLLDLLRAAAFALILPFVLQKSL